MNNATIAAITITSGREAAPADNLPALQDPLQHSGFRRFLVAYVLGTVAVQMQVVAIGWQVYELTKQPLDLAWVGLAQFLPMAALAIPAGQVADRYDRGRVFTAALAGSIAVSSLLAVGAASHAGVLPILAASALAGASRAFQMPSARPMVASLLPLEALPRAVAWSGSAWQLAAVAGPAIGGVLYDVVGPTGVYVIAGLFGLLATAFAATIEVPPSPPRGAARWSDLLEGVRFVGRSPILLGAMALDLCAVLLGGATALLPVFARDVLHAGPIGLGVLRASPAFGAVLVALALARWPVERHAGRVMLLAVGVFGAATIAFGSSTSVAPAVISLAVAGGADMVSVVIRGTLLQVHTPESMRGRVTAVNLVFVGASNELGEWESGTLAHLVGPVRAVVLGGIGTLGVVALWWGVFPSLRRVDRMDESAPVPDTAPHGGNPT